MKIWVLRVMRVRLADIQSRQGLIKGSEYVKKKLRNCGIEEMKLALFIFHYLI
jgi:hypothetical protein